MKYALVFEYMQDNLKAAKEKYQEVLMPLMQLQIYSISS